MEVAKVLHMNGGIGEASYAKNSLITKKVILMTKSIRDEAITALYRSLSPETMCIADLGCSSGPNTFLAISGLIKTIYEECKSNGQKQSPEFHVFLNDLPGNDFNTIFRSLPAFYEDLRKQMRDGFDPNCFITGVAGSFYTRLFPSKSLHFVHSSYGLQWISQVPDGIEDNKGNIYVSRTSPPTVVKAYYEQYERDFVTFLKYRSKELVKGGRMILTMLGRKNEDLYSKGCYYVLEPLAMALKELVAMGLTEEEKVNSFNIPIYNPSPAEVKYVVEKEGSFTIDVLETSELCIDVSDESCGNTGQSAEQNDSHLCRVQEMITPQDCSNGEYNAAHCLRAVTEPLLVSHFGTELNMDQVFNKCREIIVNCMAKEKTTFTNVIISMTKRN
ncbi:PREDICTED: salicylate carboxymethyltransferase-like isoform X1 [Nicotiana attenuata]|uniref:Jasmonate o-methyltransferase n=2 Tax=Nicotiana attenuata TaxID=49451 RepID=A0A1J6KR46_NICAT|nr:PREDICTED: salicylate carboxymethyltransferase-like isoform X1 [Nicotiana attenuata]OIT25259.1 jasmonate o-methyltransferase [Nicotiana attenuata]